MTIPVEIRERLGLLPNSEVEFEVVGPGANHVIEYSYRSFTRDVEYGEPVADVCKALEAASLARHVDVSAAVVGYVTPGPELRRLIAVTRGCS